MPLRPKSLLPTSLPKHHHHPIPRLYSSNSPTPKPPRPKRRKKTDESTFANAQHRPSLSGPSLGLLLTELSATRPGMEHLRREGETISEEHRTWIRRAAQLMLGVPVAIGTVIVAGGWVWERVGRRGEEGGEG